MSCHTCSMSIEAFTEEPQQAQVSQPKHNLFQVQPSSDYVCMTLPNQGCAYTAQGEYVCGGQDTKSVGCTQGPTMNFMERFMERPNLEKRK